MSGPISYTNSKIIIFQILFISSIKNHFYKTKIVQIDIIQTFFESIFKSSPFSNFTLRIVDRIKLGISLIALQFCSFKKGRKFALRDDS